MAFLDAQQGRALAIILSSISLFSHIFAFAVFETVLAQKWIESWCALFNLCAVAGSFAGVIGAIDKRPFVFSVYVIVHRITLTVVTSVLLLNALPNPIASALPPFVRQLRVADDLERSMCREDGFGWDERWLDQCRSSIAILSSGTIWIGLVVMAAQWWALSAASTWLTSRLRENAAGQETITFEPASHVDEKEGLKISEEV